jgi:hypothetical protein
MMLSGWRRSGVLVSHGNAASIRLVRMFGAHTIVRTQLSDLHDGIAQLNQSGFS